MTARVAVGVGSGGSVGWGSRKGVGANSAGGESARPRPGVNTQKAAIAVTPAHSRARMASQISSNFGEIHPRRRRRRAGAVFSDGVAVTFIASNFMPMCLYVNIKTPV